MRLASVLTPDGRRRGGLVTSAGVLDLLEAVEVLGLTLGDGFSEWRSHPGDLEAFLALPDWRQVLDRVVGYAAEPAPSARSVYPIDAVRLLCPVRRPEKIIGVGVNYQTHADEAGREPPSYPMLFGMFANALAPPNADITIPAASHRIDYEGELAVIIGREVRDVTEADSMDAVAGFAVANDVSARDLQFRSKEMLQGKTLDGFLPLGPWITTPDSVEDLQSLRLTTTVNGDLRQDAVIADMIFSVEALISYISSLMTLRPGDVIVTGTPGGIGATMDPRRWLRPGDEVKIRIDDLGEIVNRVAGRGEGG